MHSRIHLFPIKTPADDRKGAAHIFPSPAAVHSAAPPLTSEFRYIYNFGYFFIKKKTLKQFTVTLQVSSLQKTTTVPKGIAS